MLRRAKVSLGTSSHSSRTREVKLDVLKYGERSGIGKLRLSEVV